jgi:hypothetical protein
VYAICCTAVETPPPARLTKEEFNVLMRQPGVSDIVAKVKEYVTALWLVAESLAPRMPRTLLIRAVPPALQFPARISNTSICDSGCTGGGAAGISGCV